MELNEKDKELIAKIDERLKQLGLITDNKYPDEEPNPEVIKFYDRYFKKADNEQQAPVEEVVLDWYCHNKEENINIKCEVQCFNCMEELYFEPNIKDWVKGEGFIGTLKELSPRGAAYTIDDQDGSDWVISKKNAIKPTKEEIEQHLVKIAEKKYPIWTKVKEVGTDVEYTVTHNGYRYVKSLNDLSFISLEEEWDKGHSNPTIWQNGVWAEPITEQKERWEPTYNEMYWVVLVCGDIQTTQNIWVDKDLGYDYFNSYNCFKTKEEAERAAQAIRETLKNL